MKNHHPFWFLFYNLAVIPALFLGIQVARLFNPKVRQAIRERKGLFAELAEVKRRQPQDGDIVVIHCASAGEFEAARPLLAAIRNRLPHFKTHFTCFSPSGLKPISKAVEVDSYSYLPFDDLVSAHRFFRLLKPRAFLIVKHDIWPNMVWAASWRKIPTLWVNANLHERSGRFGLLSRGLNRSFLNRLSAVLTVGNAHAARLADLVSPEKISVVGDSRFDRTMDRMKQSREASEEILPAAWLKDRKVIVGGSTWGPDQRILIPAFATLVKEYPELYLILVPHEPHQNFLADTDFYLRSFGLRPVRYSQLQNDLPPSDVLLIDKVGILALLYRSAWAVYIGGAFGEGVHSVLEPAVYSLPLFFGPRYYMSCEAQTLVQRGGAASVAAPGELEDLLRRYLENDDIRQQAADKAGQVVKMSLGATERIVDHLERVLSEGSGKK